MPESHFPQLVRDLMTVGVLTCTPQTTVSELAQLFLEQCLDEIIVLDEGKALGVVGQEEIVANFFREDSKSLKAADIMREGVPQIPPDIPITAAAQIMQDLDVRSLFLMHNAGGIEYPAATITYWHFLRYLAAEHSDDLTDMGIKAERQSPLETFLKKRDMARKNNKS
jgi:predicted transcriptional regulator